MRISSQNKKTDKGLEKLWAVVVPEEDGKGQTSCYYITEGLLCRKWTVTRDDFTDVVAQIVVPLKFWKAVLELSHRGLAGHMGIRKTYNRVARRFFWPGLKGDTESVIPVK